MKKQNLTSENWQDRCQLSPLAKRKRADRRSPFGRLSREKMEQLVDLAMLDDGRCIATMGDEKFELLADPAGKGDDLKPWASKKEMSRILAASYKRIADRAFADGDLEKAQMYQKRASNTASCSSTLVFASFLNDQGEKQMTPLYVHQCHDSLCPTCEWLKSTERTKLLWEVMNRVSDRNVRLLHLVLTVPNVKPDELGKTIEAMHAGLASMRTKTWWERRILGYFAKTEFTWSENPEMIRSGRILHPHMHVLLVVSAEYFEPVPAWVKNLAETFRAINYNPRRSVVHCMTFEAAVSNVHDAVARKLLSDMEDEQTSDESADAEKSAAVRSRLFSKYRKRYWRMVKHVDEIAAQHRPSADADQKTVKQAVKDFAYAVADAADPLYINEPEQHVFLDGWRKAMKDPSITDVQLNAVTTRFGEQLNGSDFEAQLDAVKELAKYVCKSADFVFPNDPDKTDERVEILVHETMNIRMISAGGIIAKLLKEVKEDWKNQEDDEEEGDEGDGDMETDTDKSAEIVIASWSPKLHAYTVVRYPMTSDLLDEIEYRYGITISRRIRARCRDVTERNNLIAALGQKAA